jgi:hypothetical protein
MAEEKQNVEPSVSEKTDSATAVVTSGPGAKYVGITGIIFIGVYLVGIALLCLYGLVALWPVPTPARTPPPGEPAVSTRTSGPASTNSAAVPGQPTENPPAGQPQQTVSSKSVGTEPAQITLFGWQFKIWDEVRLLLIVILAGALGSLIHAVRSVYWYVGNRELVWSWLAKYVVLPFLGAALAVVFYFVIRGGFFSPQAGFEQTSPFGFAALAAMVGMFSEQAVLKLKEVAETVLAKPLPGKNADPQELSKK